MAERLDPELPQAHPDWQVWVMLLNGYGYNWYRRDNTVRADDLLIRSKASEHLAAAASHLRDTETRYRRKHLPPPTREHPDPDPARMAAARALRDLAERIAALDTRLRGAVVPPTDKIWARFRDETETLQQLADWDAMLVGSAKEIRNLAEAVTADAGLTDAADADITRNLAELGAALERRKAILGGPVV